jgi:hypothetical protein
MRLVRRHEPEVIPEYSLTGDLLSFLHCGLQYRYHNGSSLPPSRPVQLWFGEFVHGVMEAAYRLWANGAPSFPWPCTPAPYRGSLPAGQPDHDIGTIGHVVEETLRAQGKSSRNEVARASAYRRADAAVNQIGPHLFPLVSAAEEKVIGTRPLPARRGATPVRVRGDRYELHGVIDVLTNVTLEAASDGNVVGDAIRQACPRLRGRFEVIVDYKGSRRPPTTDDYWCQGEWQIQTYAWLRERQPGSLRVAAGVLLYMNELAPSEDDLGKLRAELRGAGTNVVPARGSRDDYLLNTWRPGDAPPDLSLGFRMRRAIRVIPVTRESQSVATRQFDGVVLDIEGCVAAEIAAGTVMAHWAPGGDAETCAACDFRHFCRDPYPHGKRQRIESPMAP